MPSFFFVRLKAKLRGIFLGLQPIEEPGGPPVLLCAIGITDCVAFGSLLLEVDGDSILVIAETRSGYPIGNAEIVQHVSNCFRGVRTTRNRGARLSGGVIVAAKVAPPKSALVIAAAISADCRYSNGFPRVRVAGRLSCCKVGVCGLQQAGRGGGCVGTHLDRGSTHYRKL